MAALGYLPKAPVSAIHRTGDASVPATRIGRVETIDEPARIRRIVHMLRDRCAMARVIPHSDRELVLPARWDPRAELLCCAPEGMATVDSYGPWSVYSFDVALPWRADTMPESIERRRNRRDRRVAVSRQVKIVAAASALPGHRIERAVHDVSYGGLSFKTDPIIDLVFPGLELELEFAWRGGTPIALRGMVRHVTDVPGIGPVCGVELADAYERPEWIAAVDDALHPTTMISAMTSAELWHMYEASGYFGLSGKSAAEFDELREPFAVANEALRRAPDVGARFGFRSRTGFEASMAQLHFIDGSWLGFEIARHESERALPPSGQRVLEDLHAQAYEFLQTQRDAKWLVGLVQDGPRWSRRVHHDFAERHASRGGGLVLPFRALEVPTAAEPGTHEAEVGEPSPMEYAALVDLLHRTRHPIERAAAGLEDPLGDIQSTLTRWARAGLLRRRSIACARRDGHVLGWIVLDAAQPGVHLFHLTEVMRYFPADGATSADFLALVEYARRWFADLEHRRFIYFCESDELAGLITQARDLGQAHMTILAAELVPELLEHLAELTTEPPAHRTKPGVRG